MKLPEPLTLTEVDRLESTKELVDEKEPQIGKKNSRKSTKIKPKTYCFVTIIINNLQNARIYQTAV